VRCGIYHTPYCVTAPAWAQGPRGSVGRSCSRAASPAPADARVPFGNPAQVCTLAGRPRLQAGAEAKLTCIDGHAGNDRVHELSRGRLRRRAESAGREPARSVRCIHAYARLTPARRARGRAARLGGLGGPQSRGWPAAGAARRRRAGRAGERARQRAAPCRRQGERPVRRWAQLRLPRRRCSRPCRRARSGVRIASIGLLGCSRHQQTGFYHPTLDLSGQASTSPWVCEQRVHTYVESVRITLDAQCRLMQAGRAAGARARDSRQARHLPRLLCRPASGSCERPAGAEQGFCLMWCGSAAVKQGDAPQSVL